MSKTFFTITDDLYFNGRGGLINAQRHIGEESSSVIIKTLLSVHKEIYDLYLENISDDGKLIGSERGDLIDQIDLFFDMSLLLWRSLDPLQDNIHVRIFNRRGGFLFNLREKHNIWEAEGRLTQSMLKPYTNFSFMFRNKLSEEVRNFLNRYAQAAKDNFIEPSEVKLLRNELKQVLYYTFFLRFQVERCLINA